VGGGGRVIVDMFGASRSGGLFFFSFRLHPPSPWPIVWFRLVGVIAVGKVGKLQFGSVSFV